MRGTRRARLRWDAARSVHKLALDFEDEGGVGRDVWRGALGSIGHVGGDGESPLTAHLQPGYANVPPLIQEPY
jgi:hypothetical protein